MSKESMLARLTKRRDALDVYYRRCAREIEDGAVGGEEDRIWLDQHVEGFSLDLCCGDYLIDGAIGVDSDPKKIGSSFFFLSASDLINVEAGTVDSIVTNYLDVFSNAIDVLNTWHRVLKTGGKLAIVCRNADTYEENSRGPLQNSKRVTLFNPKILNFYLRRARFQPISHETWQNSLRIVAIKT